MTARIEIGRLSAKDLGKVVTHEGVEAPLDYVEHSRDWRTGLPTTCIDWGGYSERFPSDTLIEITGTPSKENNA